MVAEHSSMAVDVPIPQIRKEIWEVIQRILRERIPNHVDEQIVEVAKAMPDERLQTAHGRADRGNDRGRDHGRDRRSGEDRSS